MNTAKANQASPLRGVSPICASSCDACDADVESQLLGAELWAQL